MTLPLSDKYVAEERAKLSDQQKVDKLRRHFLILAHSAHIAFQHPGFFDQCDKPICESARTVLEQTAPATSTTKE